MRHSFASMAVLAALASPIPALTQQGLPAAPVPQSLGVFRPDTGLLAGHLESRMTPFPILETGEAIGKWMPSAGQIEIWDEGTTIDTETSQVTAFEVTWVSTTPLSQGPLVVRFYDKLKKGNCGTLLQEIFLPNLPRGGPRGEARAWKILVDLSGGWEFSLQNPSGDFFWSLECPEHETGPYLASQDSHYPGMKKMSLTLHGSPPGITVFHPKKGTNANSLILVASAPDSRGWVHWEIPGAQENEQHLLLLATRTLETRLPTGTLLIDEQFLITAPIRIEGGHYYGQVPQLNENRIFAQAVDSLGQQWSNGIHLRW